MKMKMTLPLSLLLSLLSIHTAYAFDITQILNQYPEFTAFNSYLTQTNLAAEINRRQTLTVLVVDNGNLSPLSAKPVDLIKNILSVHVILDYFDVPKLQARPANSPLLTTLFQTTGLARGQQGFLNVTHLDTGSIAFVSAMPGSPLASNLVKSVVSQPYDISILQVSNAVIPQGIDGTKTSSPPSTAPSATPVATPPPTALPSPPTATPKASSPPVPSTAPPTPSTAAIPSTAPPTSNKAAPIPSTAPPKTSIAPIPSAATPTSSKAPVPSSVPPMAATPSASPASTSIAYSPGPASGPASAPAAEAPTSEAAGGTTPAKAKPTGKSACTALDVGLAVVFTMVLSTLYLTSTI